MTINSIAFERGAGDVKTERDKLPEWFVHSPYMNVHAGLNNSETAEYLLSAIEIFLDHAYTNIDELKNYYKDGNFNEMTIMLRALKSTSRIIGAMILSTMSGAMEKALLEQDKAYIDEEFPVLISQYKKYADLFNSHKKVEAKIDIRTDEIDDALMALKESASAEDFSLMEDGLDYLEKCNLPPDTSKLVYELKQKLFKLDWEAIHKILGLD